MIFNLAIKNLKANKKRAFITIGLSIFTTGFLVFNSGLTDGSHNAMLKSSVEIYPGYVEITSKEYRDTPNYDNLIFDTEPVNKLLNNENNIESYASRLESFVLFATNDKSVGGMLTGIEPAKEAKVSILKKSLQEGRYLQDNDTNGVYIGNELAKKLKVKLGDTVSFIGSDIDYSFAADNLKIIGIFQTGLYDFDLSSAFINKKYFDTVMNSKNVASHIVILPKDIENSHLIVQDLQGKLPKDIIVEDWKDFMSGLVESMELDSIFGYITIGFLFIVIFFVIMIYSLLSIVARTKEIGVLRALGTSKTQVFLSLLVEISLLAFIGGIIGMAAGGYANFYFFHNPIPLSGYEDQFKQYGLAAQASIPADFNIANIIRDTLIIFFLNIFSSLYPVFKVNSLKPIEAISHV